MAELLLELFSEEIPARMQLKACADLKRLMDKALKDAQLSYDVMEAYATPRRLALHITGLPTAQSDVREERRGPKADAPDKAIQGFLGSVGLSRDQVEERKDKKGSFLYAVIEKKGAPTADVFAQVIPDIVRNFPWPKSMRWGAASQTTESLRWVRPLQSILCVFDGAIVAFSIDGIQSGDETHGHRFHAPEVIKAKTFAEYEAKLNDARVILNPADRMNQIVKEANALALISKVEIVRDDALVAENAGLNEWPNVLMGSFDADFLDVPDEVLTATMRGNQKYFSLRDPKSKKLTNKFLCVANLQASDGGRAIAAGNEKVLSARLSDAKFFWDQDRKTPLSEMAKQLGAIKFHEKLGSVSEKVERVAKLARWLGEHYQIGEPSLNEEAAKLAKADLVSLMVQEFPDVQGVIGRYYADQQGKDPRISMAIQEHYAPQGPSDACPTEGVSVAVALADKIDTLVGFFAIDEKPTGSKDPYALRRAALGVIRLIVENGQRVNLQALLVKAAENLASRSFDVENFDYQKDLKSFFQERLRFKLKSEGARYDVLDAVSASVGIEDILGLIQRTESLQKFLNTPSGSDLYQAFKRSLNILKKEIGQNETLRPYAPHDQMVYHEKLLYEHLYEDGFLEDAFMTWRRLEENGFDQALLILANLKDVIDGFLDNVQVVTDDKAMSTNRLALLQQFVYHMYDIADFSRIEG
jgi:glycyl-tRNA synthetase beta chain